MDIEVKNIPQKDIEEANRILNMKNMSHRGRMSKISALTGLCCHSNCHEKPAQKIVLFKLKGICKIERYCLEHFRYSEYEDKKKKSKRVKKK